MKRTLMPIPNDEKARFEPSPHGYTGHHAIATDDARDKFERTQSFKPDYISTYQTVHICMRVD